MKIQIDDGLRDRIANFAAAFDAKIKSLHATQDKIVEVSQVRSEADEKVRSLEQSESLPSDKEVTSLLVARARRELLATRLQNLDARLKPERDEVLNCSHQAGELFRAAVAQQLEEKSRSRFIETLPASMRTTGWQTAWSGSAERRALGVFFHPPVATRHDEVSEICTDAEERLGRLRALLAGDEIEAPITAT